MNAKVTGIVAYITWVGALVALLAGDKEGAKIHVNQGLVLGIITLLCSVVSIVTGFIPIIGAIISILLWVINVACFVLMIMGIINAANGQDKALPIVGSIQIIK